MAFTTFMHRTGLISTEPTDRRDLFFDNLTAGGVVAAALTAAAIVPRVFALRRFLYERG